MRLRPLALIALLIAVAVLTARASTAHQRRDSTAAPATVRGAEISGVVVHDDATRQPVRRAIVTITGGDVATSRSALTDDNGGFVFGDLPAGRFAIRVKKAAYLAAVYGAAKPGREGSEIRVAAGQRSSVTITMSRGAVLSGTLRDAFGQPLAGTTVYALDMRGQSGTDYQTTAGEMQTTDDRGNYRFFGLMPGEYVVAAVPSVSAGGQIGIRSTQEMDTLLAELAQKHPNGGLAPPPSPTVPLLPLPQSAGFGPVYYPGNVVFSEAIRIQVAAGEERAGIDFPLIPVPVATVSGMVSGDIGNPASVQLSLIFNAPRIVTSLGTSAITGQPLDAEGRFKFTNVAPGQLRIVARARRGPAPDLPVNVSGRGGGASIGVTPPPGRGADPATPVEWLFGVVDLDVRGQDITGINIPLQPGGTLSGKVVFDALRATPPEDWSNIQVNVAQPAGSFSSSNGTVTMGTSIVSVPSVPVNSDGTFVVTGIGPAQYRVNCVMPAALSSVWRLRSAMFEGRDLLDAPLELGPGMAVKGVVLTVSDKRTEINGVLQTPTGQPATAYYVVAFPADRTLWKAGARRVRSARPGSDGQFLFADLPPGSYLIAALTDLDPNDLLSPSFLEQVLPAGVPVTIKEGETKTQDLKIVGGT